MSLFDTYRPPREEMYEEETEKVIEAIRNRGDQRIGQFILNLIRSEYDRDVFAEYDFEDVENFEDVRRKRREALREMRSEQFQKLWNIEDDELAEISNQKPKEI